MLNNGELITSNYDFVVHDSSCDYIAKQQPFVDRPLICKSRLPILNRIGQFEYSIVLLFTALASAASFGSL